MQECHPRQDSPRIAESVALRVVFVFLHAQRGARVRRGSTVASFFSEASLTRASRGRRTYALRRGRNTHTHPRASCDSILFGIESYTERLAAALCLRRVSSAWSCALLKRMASLKGRVDRLTSEKRTLKGIKRTAHANYSTYYADDMYNY